MEILENAPLFTQIFWEKTVTMFQKYNNIPSLFLSGTRTNNDSFLEEKNLEFFHGI